jgi:hypothetical protein
MDADLDLALPGRGDFDIFDLEDFGAASLVKSYDFGHVLLLL